MALESVNSSPPSSGGGLGYKDTLKDHDGEIHRLDTNDEKLVDPDLEEGEILDSGGEVLDEVHEESKKKKKKKKKKKRQANESADGSFENSHSQMKKKRKYGDHERAHNSEEEFEMSGGRKRHHQGSKSHSAGHHSSPRKMNGENKRKLEENGMHYAEQNDEFYNSDEHYSDEISEHIGRRRSGKGGRPLKRKRGAEHGGRGGKSGRRIPLDNSIRKQVCKFYLEGKCLKGEDCTYRHDISQPKRKELCKFYLNGFCRSGDGCLYMHEQFPCKFFHTGAKCYSDENCRFSHDPLNDDTKIMLANCLDSGRLPNDLRNEDFSGGKRPSLLGSPPKNKNSPDNKKNMFDPSVGPRFNYYQDVNEDENEVMNDYGEYTPVNSDGQGDSWDGERTNEEMNDLSEVQRTIENFNQGDVAFDSQKGDDSEESESKQASQSQEIPTHLPKRQRELFLRIQQQQREAEIQQEGAPKSDTNEEEENWYSDDDDEEEEGDQPLTAVLKKIQQQPNSVDLKEQSSTAPTFDIASMISAIRNQTPSQVSSDENNSSLANKSKLPKDSKMVRDPRLSKDSKVADEGKSVMAITKTIHQKTADGYYLITMDVSLPGNYNKYAIASQSNTLLQNDPRIKKIIDKFGCIENIIIEEEKKPMPTLPDFVPPPSVMSSVEMIDKKILPNYSKGIDPRTGRRPPLLPPPMPDAPLPEPSQGQGSFNFPGNQPIPRMPAMGGGFQSPEQFGKWSQRCPDPRFFNQSFGNQRPNQAMMNFPESPDQAGPFMFNMQGNPRMNRDLPPNRDPRTKDGPQNCDPRIMDAVQSQELHAVDNTMNRVPRGMDAPQNFTSRTNRIEPGDLRNLIGNVRANPRGTNMEFQRPDPRTVSGDARDPRMQRALNMQATADNTLNAAESDPNLINPNVKHMFSAIDPTASPFC